MSHYVTSGMKWLPSAALGTSITPSGTAWANSNWAQISASMSQNSQIGAVTIDTADATAAGFELEIGVGASGSETPIAIVRGSYQSSVGQVYFPLPVLVGGISSGVRLAARLRKAGTSTTVWRISVGYYENATSDNISTGPEISFPSGASAPTVTPSGTAWANSSWVELSSNVGYETYIQGLSVNPGGTAAIGFEIDLGIGASGSETVLTTLRGRYDSNVGMQIIPFMQPIGVPSGSRLSFRLRKNNTNTTVWSVGAYGMQLPNTAPSTPTLSSPADAGTTSTLLPVFTFTTTDPDGNDITYEIQIDTTNTFDSQ